MTDMQKKPIFSIAMLALSLLAACNNSKSPDAVATQVAEAEQTASKEVANAQTDAAQDVNKAAEKGGDKTKDLIDSAVTQSYNVTLAKADGDRKIAIAKCSAFT